MTVFSIATVLFLIMDPFGHISSFLTMVKELSPKRQRWVAVREMFIALFLMLLFNLIGEYIFTILEISEITVRLSIGLILFLTALKILFPGSNSLRNNISPGEPFVIPFAIPMIAGPSLLASVMLFAHLEPSLWLMLGAILLSWSAAFIVLLLSPLLKRYLGTNGLAVCERLMGMILIMMAIQRFMEGVQLFFATYG
jgi:multiple antibiotic resistance protein